MKNLKAQKNESKKAFSLFGTLRKQIKKVNEIFWVIEENEEKRNEALVKFYNQCNQLIHQERVRGIQANVIDQSTLYQLNQIKKRVSQSFAA